MQKRYAYLWFRFLLTDWLVIRRPELKEMPFVFAASDHGRMLVTATSPSAQQRGINIGMYVADAKTLCPDLEVMDDKPGRSYKLLKGLGIWCVRYSPIVAIDEFSMNGLFLDTSGCTHLWGGEAKYLKEIVLRLQSEGYTIRMAIADTPGAAWAIARYATKKPIAASGEHMEALLSLPPESLRLSEPILSKLSRLGFYQNNTFMKMPRSVLRRRFGNEFIDRLGQALGTVSETLKPIRLPVPFKERMACLEPIRTRQGIEIAIDQLLKGLCEQLQKERKGLRLGCLTCYRIDNKVIKVDIGTNEASSDPKHLYGLFQLKIEKIRPGLGIELFVMEAVKVNDAIENQEVLWLGRRDLTQRNVIRLLDRVAGRVGATSIHRYMPAEHSWPERSFKATSVINEKFHSEWPVNKRRPTELLKKPERIDVMSVVPDYPPKFFVYKGIKHTVVKADGPERIEREWWLEDGLHRDYYQVEDEEGQRYWLFRSGHHEGKEEVKWFIHGFLA